MVLEGGACAVGIESTVISLAGSGPKILRPGMISRTQIEEMIGPVDMGAGAESPGQHVKHYSPRTRVVLGEAPSCGRGVWIACGPSAAAFAEGLYARLHDLDQMGYDWIAIEMPPETPEWAGVRDRLMRSAVAV
jgi:L-threonylcarbamoyladenylate synthase